MAMRLPMRLPLMVTCSTGRRSGESAVAMASSHGRSMPRLRRCALKSAGVLRVGMRVSFFASVMFEEEKFLALGFAPDEESEFARMVIAPHGAFAVGNALAFVDLVPAVGAMVDRVEEEAFVLGGFR